MLPREVQEEKKDMKNCAEYQTNLPVRPHCLAIFGSNGFFWWLPLGFTSPKSEVGCSFLVLKKNLLRLSFAFWPRLFPMRFSSVKSIFAWHTYYVQQWRCDCFIKNIFPTWQNNCSFSSTPCFAPFPFLGIDQWLSFRWEGWWRWWWGPPLARGNNRRDNVLVNITHILHRGTILVPRKWPQKIKPNLWVLFTFVMNFFWPGSQFHNFPWMMRERLCETAALCVRYLSFWVTFHFGVTYFRFIDTSRPFSHFWTGAPFGFFFGSRCSRVSQNRVPFSPLIFPLPEEEYLFVLVSFRLCFPPLLPICSRPLAVHQISPFFPAGTDRCNVFIHLLPQGKF